MARVSQAELLRRRVHPKDCIVARVDLDRDGNAELGLRCGDPTGPGVTGGLFVGLRRVETAGASLAAGETVSTYPSVHLRGITSVRIGEDATMVVKAGRAGLGFVLSPRAVVCERDHFELKCKVR